MRAVMTTVAATALCAALLASCTSTDPSTPSPASSLLDGTPTAPPTSTNTPTSPGTPVPTRSPEATAGTARGSVQVERTLATGIDVPWGLAVVSGGAVLVSSRDTAQVLRVPLDGGEPTVVGTVPGVAHGGEGGLLGLATPTPGATTVYAYLTTDRDNRVVRMAYDPTRPPGDQLGEPRVVVAGIPAGTYHNGGRLAFGPDGMLYVSTGEAGEPSHSQDRGSLGGKILRMTPDGQPAPGNPFGTLVFSYGHRNVQGLAFDPAGRLWASEFGNHTADELNLIRAGHNYGWPDAEGRGGGFTDPVAQWGTEVDSPSGIAYAAGSIWMAALAGERLWRIPLDGDRLVADPRDFLVGEYGRLRSVLALDDHTLLVTTSNRDGRGDPAGNDDRILVLKVA